MAGSSSYIQRGGLALVAIGITGFVADYVMNVGLSRLLPVHEYGDFKVAWTFTILFGAFVLLGGDRACPKALSGPLERGETAHAWEYLRFYMLVGVALSAIVIAVTWLVGYLNVGSTDPEEQHAIAWLALSIPFLAVGAMMSRTVQSAKHPARAALPWRVVLPIFYIAVIGVLAWVKEDVRLLDILLAAIAAVMVVTVWQWYDARRIALPELRRDPASARRREWLATSLPMTGFFLVSVALSQSDLFFLEALGDEREVGMYAAAFTTAHFLVLIQTTVVGLMAPLISLALEGDAEAQAKVVRQGRLAMMAGIVPAFVILFAAGNPILGLFGSEYPAAEPELRWLLVGNATWASAALASLWLQYSGRGKTVLVIAVTTLVVDSALNLALIPEFGMLGAAASTAATLALGAVALALCRSRLWSLGKGTERNSFPAQ